MIYLLIKQYPNVSMALGFIFTFALTLFLTGKFMHILPADEGREFAVQGGLSKGKPRGAGLIFVICFIIGVLLFSPVFKMKLGYSAEILVYLVIIFAEMMTGYLDDKAEKPWSRVKKGLLDLAISIELAAMYIYSNSSTVYILDYKLVVPIWLLGLFVVVLCWVMINVTNCADGVDGLSATLVITTLLSFLAANSCGGSFGHMHGYRYVVVFFIAALLAYMCFNAGPSILMMGDAGSRAMGVFLCITALKSGHPLLIIPFALVIILDGGLGLFKVSIIKITKKKDFMHMVRTPLHDHVRKNLKTGWSNNQCVTRFWIIQILISVVTIYLFCK